ncbi:hypothetical protein H310_10274 [Aphanomyces invadans]|uniref:Uncharacterized protein n=1 Tax=Aphanomyces invadans TaxID=157072 RepID=A0A024TSF8_9STRA|nr:hypothetical protein H310_10274 [Aphanomyces invadans]ETV96571.1 hypothetical protein H310_10274 [Aphanomyces invadans]|eukprot:XP_008874834.1 hypothetical protein H310_10274 [Aphanomyces invadans]
MPLWSLPSWDNCSESSDHASMDALKHKDADDAVSSACYSDTRFWTRSTRSDKADNQQPQELPLCTELHRIHERFESLRLQLDVERRTVAPPPPQQPWFPRDSGVLMQHPIRRRAQPPSKNSPFIETGNHAHSKIPSMSAESNTFSSPHSCKEMVATTMQATVDNGAKSTTTARPVVVHQSTNTDQDSRTHISLVKAQTTQTQTDFQDSWLEKIAALDGVVSALSSKLNQQTDAAALAMYVAWLSETMQTAVATLPVSMERSPRKESAELCQDISTLRPPRFDSLQVPAHSAGAMTSIESSLTTLVKWCHTSYDNHTRVVHHVKNSAAKRYQKAAHEAATFQGKWETALRTIHSLQDERNALQAQLHGQVLRTAAVEKDLLVTQLKVTTLEQQCRDLQDQLRLQELAWKEELTKASPSSGIAGSPPLPFATREHVAKGHAACLPPCEQRRRSAQLEPALLPKKITDDGPEESNDPERNEWWKDDERSSCVDDDRQPEPRTLQLPPPVPPMRTIFSAASRPQSDTRFILQRPDSHTRMLLEYLHSASNASQQIRRQDRHVQRACETSRDL